MGVRITGNKYGHKCFNTQPVAVDKYPTRREVGTEAVCDQCGRQWVVKPLWRDVFDGRRRTTRNVWVPVK